MKSSFYKENMMIYLMLQRILQPSAFQKVLKTERLRTKDEERNLGFVLLKEGFPNYLLWVNSRDVTLL